MSSWRLWSPSLHYPAPASMTGKKTKLICCIRLSRFSWQRRWKSGYLRAVYCKWWIYSYHRKNQTFLSEHVYCTTVSLLTGYQGRKNAAPVEIYESGSGKKSRRLSYVASCGGFQRGDLVSTYRLCRASVCHLWLSEGRPSLDLRVV